MNAHDNSQTGQWHVYPVHLSQCMFLFTAIVISQYPAKWKHALESDSSSMLFKASLDVADVALEPLKPLVALTVCQCNCRSRFAAAPSSFALFLTCGTFNLPLRTRKKIFSDAIVVSSHIARKSASIAGRRCPADNCIKGCVRR